MRAQASVHDVRLQAPLRPAGAGPASRPLVLLGWSTATVWSATARRRRWSTTTASASTCPGGARRPHVRAGHERVANSFRRMGGMCGREPAPAGTGRGRSGALGPRRPTRRPSRVAELLGELPGAHPRSTRRSARSSPRRSCRGGSGRLASRASAASRSRSARRTTVSAWPRSATRSDPTCSSALTPTAPGPS